MNEAGRLLFISDTRLPKVWWSPPAVIINDSVGGTASFLGTVRNEHLGKPVTGIDYQCYQELAEAVLPNICDECCRKWGNQLRLAIAHGSGRHEVGDLVVAIHVGAPHREAAFAACRHVIERIKEDLPVWKHEHYADGSAAWLPGS